MDMINLPCSGTALNPLAVTEPSVTNLILEESPDDRKPDDGSVQNLFIMALCRDMINLPCSGTALNP